MNQAMLVLEQTEGREEENKMTLPGGNGCRRFVCVQRANSRWPVTFLRK